MKMTGFPDSITGTTLDSATRAAIFKSLKSVSRRSARPCLDAVLRQLASAIDALERGERLLSPFSPGAATVSEKDARTSRVESVTNGYRDAYKGMPVVPRIGRALRAAVCQSRKDPHSFSHPLTSHFVHPCMNK